MVESCQFFKAFPAVVLRHTFVKNSKITQNLLFFILLFDYTYMQRPSITHGLRLPLLKAGKKAEENIEKGIGMISTLLKSLGYVKGEPLTFLSKRICGLWLVWIAAVILVGTLFGGAQMISMPIFATGYFLGFALILANKRVYKKLAFGRPSRFQNRMTVISIFLAVLLLIGMGGPFFDSHQYRMIWLAAFLAFGIHFFPFAAVHGKIMLPLGALCSANAIAGMLLSNVPFTTFAYADVAVMGIFGIILLRSKNPLTLKKTVSETLKADKP
jgi:hypothetical protein